MKRRLVLFLGCFEALVVLSAVYLEPSYCVRGGVWREAFFEGRPTSYWNQELERWHVRYIDLSRFDVARVFVREQSTLERWRNRWFVTERTGPPEEFGPSILNGGEAARPVLEELLKVGSPKVCTFANIGLGIDPNMPVVQESSSR